MDTLRLHDTLLSLHQGDLTDHAVDVIVNAANSSLLGGGGVDGAIHRRGGPAILAACRHIRASDYPNGLPTGEAVITTAGDLSARFVIHTVGPVWQGGDHGEAALLQQAYRNVLRVARTEGLRTVAFPSISTGAYGYDIAAAAPLALATASDVVTAHPGAFDELRFVLFSAGDLAVYRDALAGLRA